MQTPVKMEYADLSESLHRWLEDNCHRHGTSHSAILHSCGQAISHRMVMIRVHKPADCAAKDGHKIVWVNVPYCPHCEELPAAVGCVHE